MFTPVDTAEELVIHVGAAAVIIAETPGTFEHTINHWYIDATSVLKSVVSYLNTSVSLTCEISFKEMLLST